MTKSPILLRSLATLLVLPIIARAQAQPDPRQLMRELAEQYKRTSSYYLDFTVVSHTKTESFRSKTDMTVEQSFVLAGNKAVPEGNRAARSLAEIGSPVGPLTIICDGKIKWTFAPQLKQFTKKVLGAPADMTVRAPSDDGILAGLANLDMTSIFATQATMLLTQMGTISDRIKEARYLPEEKLPFDGKNTDALVVEVEYLSSMSGQSSRATFWVDKEKHVILREVAQQIGQSSFGGSTTTTVTTTFKRVQLNEPVSDALFAFRPPADAKEVEKLDFVAASKPSASAELTGHDAADFTLKDLDGNEVSLHKLKGKVVVLDFWATWCAPCLIELPHIEKLHNELKDRGVVFLGINNEDADTAREFMHGKGYTFPSLIDADKEVDQRYEIQVIPQTIVIDKTGKIVAHYFGTRNEEELRNGLAKAGVPRPVKSVQASVSPAVRAEGGQEAMEPVEFSEARPVTRVDAAYPAEAGGVSGSVEVLVAISPAGTVVEALPISGNPLLQWNAMQSARKWTFKPVLRDGKPVAAATVLTFNFAPPVSQQAAPRGSSEAQTQGGESPYAAGDKEFRNGHYDRAVELYNQVKPGDRDYTNARYYIGLSYSRLERYRDAATAYRQLIDLEPANIFAHYELGKASFKLGDRKATEQEQQFLSDKSPELSRYLNDYVSGTTSGLVGDEAALSGPRPPAVEAGRDGATKPTILYKEKAQYTEIARRNRLQGTVVLSAVFTKEGEIRGIRVIRALPDGLTEHAIEATQKIKFQPATKDGQPVDVRANLEFTFNLY
jgi:TonB family protein